MPSIFPKVDQANEYGIIALGASPDPIILLEAYKNGIFPWPHPEIEELPWFAPPERGILPLDSFNGISRINRYIKKEGFKFYCNTAFQQVILECSKPKNRAFKSSWITKDMIEGYTKLHKMGFAHSIEVFKDNVLVGGVYGVSLGKMFAAESMFYRVSNASKAALLVLKEIIETQGATWIDCQQLTEHLAFLGGIEIPRDSFMELLKISLDHQNMIFLKGEIKRI